MAHLGQVNTPWPPDICVWLWTKTKISQKSKKKKKWVKKDRGSMWTLSAPTYSLGYQEDRLFSPPTQGGKACCSHRLCPPRAQATGASFLSDKREWFQHLDLGYSANCTNGEVASLVIMIAFWGRSSSGPRKQCKKNLGEPELPLPSHGELR